jgi:hypothetical protein
VCMASTGRWASIVANMLNREVHVFETTERRDESVIKYLRRESIP